MDNLYSFYIAIYGAILSTSIFIWEVYKEKKKNHIKVDFQTNGVILLIGTERCRLQDKYEYLVATVINKGSSPTTITRWGAYCFENWYEKYFNKKIQRVFFWLHNDDDNSMPKRLDCGEYAIFTVKRTSEFEEYLSKNLSKKYCFLEIRHTMGKSTKRVKIRTLGDSYINRPNGSL